MNTDEAEQRASNGGPYDAEQEVHKKPHLALHELLREPTGNSANDDGCNPADLLFFPLESLLMGSEASIIYRFAVFPELIRTASIEGSAHSAAQLRAGDGRTQAQAAWN
jgi:hypothetical protein